jgi:hypothetical protein
MSVQDYEETEADEAYWRAIREALPLPPWERPPERPQAADEPRKMPQPDPPAEEMPAADELTTTQKHAFLLREEAASFYLGATHGPFFHGQMKPLAFNSYVHQLLHDAGDPKDPIERMLVEELVLAHHNIGRLHVLAADAQGATEACPAKCSATPPQAKGGSTGMRRWLHISAAKKASSDDRRLLDQGLGVLVQGCCYPKPEGSPLRPHPWQKSL